MWDFYVLSLLKVSRSEQTQKGTATSHWIHKESHEYEPYKLAETLYLSVYVAKNITDAKRLLNHTENIQRILDSSQKVNK